MFSVSSYIYPNIIAFNLKKLSNHDTKNIHTNYDLERNWNDNIVNR